VINIVLTTTYEVPLICFHSSLEPLRDNSFFCILLGAVRNSSYSSGHFVTAPYAGLNVKFIDAKRLTVP